MDIYKKIYKNVIYPGYHLIKNDGFIEAEKQVRTVEKLTKNEYLEHQHDKINALLRHVFLNVPYYKDKLIQSGISSAKDLTWKSIYLLPVLSKSSISNDFNRFVTEDPSSHVLLDNSTSGSSGHNFHFKTDIKSYAYRAAIVDRTYRQIGIERGDKEAMLWGANIDINISKNLRGWIRSRLIRRIMLSSYKMTEQDLSIYIEKLNKFKPKLLTSYPGPLEVFSRFCTDNGKNIPSLKAIITSAEMLYPHQRELFENTFNVNVFNRYGCREFGCIAQEVSAASIMPVNGDHVFVEILREDGNACDEGEVGEVVITDLDNFGMPLIRYLVGDRAAWVSNSIYRQENISITKLEGRSLDVIVAPNGNRIGGTFWTLLMKSQANIIKFQIYQVDENLINIKYQSKNILTVEEQEYFIKEIKNKCGDDMIVKFKKVDLFDSAVNGKHRIIISKTL